MSAPWGKLISINRKGLAEDFDLTANLIKIGRGEGNEIKLDNPKVSKVHCIITKEDSKIFIEDKSSNGTYIDNKIIGNNKKVELTNGDIIYLLHKDKVKGKCEDVGLIFSLQKASNTQSQMQIEQANEAEFNKIKEELQKAREQKKQMAEELIKNFKCLICQDIIHDCATINCLHNFCGGCLSDYLYTSKQDSCPTCRKPITSAQKNANINSAVQDTLKKSPHLKRHSEEYEELNLKNVITFNSQTRNEIVNAMKKQSQKPDYQVQLSDIQERLQRRLKGEVDSDYSYISENEEEDDKIKPEECPECKIERHDDQFKCKPGQSHLSCTSCKRQFPERDDQVNQKCILCNEPYCGLYLGVCKNNMSHTQKKDKYLSRFDEYKAPQSISQNTFRNNNFETQILNDYLKQNKLSLQSVLDYMIENQVSKNKFYFEKSKNILQNYTNPTSRIQVQPSSPVCSNCFPVIWNQIVFRYRIDIKNNLPTRVANRELCRWGINCRTQTTKQSHAENYDHVCEQTRFQ